MQERKGGNSSALSEKEVGSFENWASSSTTAVLKVWSLGPWESLKNVFKESVRSELFT